MFNLMSQRSRLFFQQTLIEPVCGVIDISKYRTCVLKINCPRKVYISNLLFPSQWQYKLTISGLRDA